MSGPGSGELVEDRYLPERAAARDSLFTIGNGYLATRGTFEEPAATAVRATFVNGLFVRPPGDLPLLGAVPDWTRLLATIDGVPFSLDEQPPAGYRRRLDLDTGLLERTVLWRAAAGGVVRLRFRRIAAMHDPHLVALDLEVEALTDPVSVAVATGIDATVPGPEKPLFEPVDVTVDGHLITGRYRSIDDAHEVHVACRVDVAGDVTVVESAEHPRLTVARHLAAGERLQLTKVASYATSRDLGAPAPLPGEPFDTLEAASAQAWQRRWRSSRIEVDGDPQAERALRFAAFHLLAAAPSGDPGASLGAKLMSGFGYRHHVFWDTDVFVVPYLTVTQPDLARNHLAYRHQGLAGARAKARQHGRQGAFYAWESADDGTEVTPQWTSSQHGEPVRIWTGELQDHITADVAWAAHHNWRWTGDDAFMAAQGAEMIVAGAVYWRSRLEEGPGGLHLCSVIGPDEYHTHVDDDFYTLRLARWQLVVAADLIRELPGGDAAWRALAAWGVGPGDADSFDQTAARIMVPDRRHGVWEQFTGYFDLRHLDLARLVPRSVSVQTMLGDERIQRLDVIKQPSVLMALMLLDEGEDTLAANWDHYLARTDHGSSLSLAVHARVAARLGDLDAATDLFRRAAAIDLDDTMGNGRDGVHAAALGGLLQAALFGFGGLQLTGDGPVTDPRLPPEWRALAFSYFTDGTLHDVELTNGSSGNEPAQGSHRQQGGIP